MPLDRQHVTAASRIMLPAYVGFFALLGLNYLATPRTRLTASPGLAYADGIMPLSVWGLFFLACAALMAAALLTHRRSLYRYALLLCALAMGVWTVVGIVAAFGSQATPAGWAYPAFVVAACYASYRSLSTREVD